MNVLVLHGPNLNLLGERPGDAPGLTLERLNQALETQARTLGVTLKILQSNHEGALVDALHEERRWMDGALLNPTALGPVSVALRDAISGVQKPVVEVYLEDLKKAEPWRRKSMLKEVCVGQVAGKGLDSYRSALTQLAKQARPPERSVAAAPVSPEAPRTHKTLGRKAVPPTAKEGGTRGSKSLGKAPPRSAGSPSLTRAQLREKVKERLSGRLTPAALAAWARSQYQSIQGGAAVESGQRDLLEDLLQQLLLFSLPPNRLSDEQLIDVMTRLDG